MKFKTYFLFLSFYILFSNCAGTQNNLASPTKVSNNLEFSANQQTAELVDQLKLTDEQTEKVKAINLSYLEKAQSLRAQANGDRSAMQALRTSMQNDKNAEMKLVLTDSQYQKYLTLQSENQGRSRGSGGRSRGL